MIRLPYAAVSTDPAAIAARLARGRARHGVERAIRAALAQIAAWPAGMLWVDDGSVYLARVRRYGAHFGHRLDPVGPDVVVMWRSYVWYWESVWS